MLKVIGGAQEGKFKATASGTLPNGKPVVVNSDGTVSVVDLSDSSLGTSAVFESGTMSRTSAVYDANAQKVVIAYRDDSPDYGTAVVGTVSGTSITFGTPVVFNQATTLWIAAVYDPNAQKVVLFYSDYGNSRNGTAIVGTVSGTSISFGSEVEFESADSFHISAVYEPNAQKIVVAYKDALNSNYGTAIVGTVSGTSISFGSPVIFESANTEYTSTSYDSNTQKVVIAYRDVGNSYYGTAVVGTVSGTSISFGTPVVYNQATTTWVSNVYDSSAQKIVIGYTDGGNSSHGTAIVGTVSGTSISFGSPVVFESATTSYISISYNPNINKSIFAYRDSENSSYGTLIDGAVSGTSISFGSPTVFESAATSYISNVYDSNNEKMVIGYRDEGNSNYGTAIVFQPEESNLTAENYIGISSGGAVADTGNATVDIIGTVNKDQTGLTAGEKYYVQNDGTLSTTADDPSVLAGTAISATKLVVKT